MISRRTFITVLAASAASAPIALRAQETDATPEAPMEDAAGVVPVIGDEVPYIGEAGNDIATISVLQVVRGWDEYDEFSEPEGGTEYIAVELAVTHLGRRGDLLVRPYDFRIQDVDGFLISEAWVDARSGAELVPSDDEVLVASGETESVVVIFQVLEGIPLSHLFWSPEYDRLITLADLTGL
jgi:hypothetical protein